MKKKHIGIIIIVIIAAITIFGFLQYYSATQLNVVMKSSKIESVTEQGTFYTIQIEFENPSPIILNIGKTDFVISTNGEDLGAGILDPVIVPAMGKTISNTPFLADNRVLDKYKNDENTPSLKLDGTTKYSLLFTSIGIPFTYYPTEEEAREFIHGQ